jgi:hypothetical protein
MEGFFQNPNENLGSQEHSKEINPKHNEESEVLPLLLFFFNAPSRISLFDLIHMTLIPLLFSLKD